MIFIMFEFSWWKLQLWKPQRLFGKTMYAFHFGASLVKCFSDENISGWCCTRELWKVIPGISQNVINMLCFLICLRPCLFLSKGQKEGHNFNLVFKQSPLIHTDMTHTRSSTVPSSPFLCWVWQWRPPGLAEERSAWRAWSRLSCPCLHPGSDCP